MKSENDLQFGPLGAHCVHICVDMQRMFGEDTPWHAPWMMRVLPNVEKICRAHPAETIFTRFIPLQSAEQGRGTWRRYYERWSTMTLERLEPGLVDLIQPLETFVPPAEVIDKTVYSPWPEGGIGERLKARGADTVVVSGGETDVCVLGTVLGAVDAGYRTIVVTDALCSSSDETHDAMMLLYRNRYGSQVEILQTDDLLALWG